MSYFAMERGGKCYEQAEDVIVNRVNMVQARIDILKASTYEEMLRQHWLEGFVLATYEAADEVLGDEDDQTIITLIDDNGIFVWSIIIGVNENSDLNYVFVDWKKDGKNYRYEPENGA